MGSKQAPTSMRIKGDRLMFSSSDESNMTKQIQATHAPDGRAFDVKPLLHVVEDIFTRAETTGSQAHVEALEDKTHSAGFTDKSDALAYIIDTVSCEITCKCSGGGDAHSTTMSVLNMVTSYSWDAKMVLALAAFAASYGQFWLVAQTHTSNQLARSVAVLKQVPSILAQSSLSKPRFDAIRSLIKAMLDVTKCVVEFKELPSQYIAATDVTELSSAMAHIPVAAYWTIRSAVACASQIASLAEYITSTTEAWELSSLAHKISNIHSHLLALLATCHKLIDEKKQIEAYQTLVRLFDMVQTDNMKVLKALIYAKDDLQPLVDGATKNRVNIEVLRRKYVLLLISDLDMPIEELEILEHIYKESRHNQYEVVWVPIHDDSSIPWTENKQKQFEHLQATMPWYTLHHPSLIGRAVIRYTKEVWHFGKKPILVVLDPQGRLACPNALHMMWIWGSRAFPFTTLREEALWNEEAWNIELLVNGIDPLILNWIEEGRYICLYGGEDIEWIRQFTTTARGVAQAANISLGMVYVGKSNPKERVRRNITTISNEKLSHYWQELASIWYFWVRIESMWHSKIQLGKTVENDPVLQEIMAMMNFNEGGWALLSRGRGSTMADIIRAKGSSFLNCLLQYDMWKKNVEVKGFIEALKDHLLQIQSKTPHHCNQLVLPGTNGRVPERLVCSECGRAMERFVMYQCCDE